MSEEGGSGLYASVRESDEERNEERLAEYFMSRLALASLSDLVTKDYLTAELSRELTRFATKEEMHAGFAKQQESIDKLWQQREADRAEAVARREADRAEAAAQREADRAETAAQREADREARQAESRQQTRWLIGAFFAAVGVNIGGLAAIAALFSGGG